MRSDCRAVLALIWACCEASCLATGDGTMLLDDATSRTRVVTNAFFNASNAVHDLIQKVSPKADFSPSNSELVETISGVADDQISVATNDLMRDVLGAGFSRLTTNDVENIVTNTEPVYSIWQSYDMPVVDSPDFDPTYQGYVITGVGYSQGVWYVAYQDTSGQDANTYESSIVGSEDSLLLTLTNATKVGTFSVFRTIDGTRNALGLARLSDLNTSINSNEVIWIASNLTTALENRIVNGDVRAYYANIANEATTSMKSFALDGGYEGVISSEDVIAQLASASHLTTNDVCNIVTNEISGWTKWVWSDGVNRGQPTSEAETGNPELWTLLYSNRLWTANAPTNATSLDLSNDDDIGILYLPTCTRQFLSPHNALGLATIADLSGYVPYTQDINGSNTALTVGRRAGNAGPNSFAVGYDVQTPGSYSVAFGNQTEASAYMTMALGSRAKSTNSLAYTWSGTGSAVKYGSHGIGTYNINPSNGEYGLFIGDKPLHQIFSEWATGTTQSVIAEYAFDDGDSESYEYREYAPLALAKAEDVESVRREASASFALFQGSNIVLTVTNYNSVVHDPSLYLRQLNESNEYITVWHEKTGLEKTLQKANEYADGLGTNYAPKAWSRVTSGLGAEAPENTTWISTPMTVFAGGLEYAKYLTTGGAVYVLTGNGMATFNPNTNSYFTISTDDGEELFSIQKTDSQILPIDASGISVQGNVVTVPINLVSSTAPILSMCTDIIEKDWKSEADDGGIPSSLATSAWTQTANGWVNTVTLASPVPNSAFFKYSVMQEGETIIKNKAQSNFDGGVNINGVRYRVVPYTTGGKTYMTLEAW